MFSALYSSPRLADTMVSSGNTFPRLVLQHVEYYVLLVDFLVSTSNVLEVLKMLLDLPIKLMSFVPVAPTVKV